MATIDSVKLPDNSTYDLTDNYSGYQTETLATPITVDGTSETTVEGALGAVNDYADKIKGSMSNENLLDNPFFTVNERGATNGTTGIYEPADRWDLSYGSGGVTWSRTADTITMQSTTGLSVAYLMQKMEQGLYNFLGGKTVTISVMLGDYTIITGTTTFKNDQTFSTELAVDGQGNRTICTVNNSTRNFTITQEKTAITLRAVKLELGSISTLANDVAPDNALELAKCQTSTADPSDTYANQGQLMTSALQGVLGAKNLFENVAISQTINGLVITKNADKSIACTSNNVALSNDVDILLGVITLPVGRYIVSNAHNSDAAIGGNNYFTYLTNVNGSASWVAVSTYDVANRILDITTETQIQFRLHGDRNEIFPATTFYPMIRDARITDPTYQPFAMTNKQLTEGKADKWTLVATVTGDGVKTWAQILAELSSSYNSSEFYKHCIVLNNESAFYPMSRYSFVQVNASDTNYASIYFRMINMYTSTFHEAINSLTPTDYSSGVFPSGYALKLYKIG